MSADPTTTTTDYDVLVVGAGFSGLYLLHRLRAEGHRVHVVERGPEVGGTWFFNRYPGARCDVESVDYSYSWDDDLQQEWTWTEKYPAQADILAYLKHVADRFDLRKDIDFNTALTSARWDESQGNWTAHTDDGRAFRARYLLMAVGCLSAPKDIDLPGFDAYTGRVLRTFDWPDGEDLKGLTVGVVGTGSTGAQVIPALSETVADLTVIQRTPNFVIPTRNRDLHDGELDEIKADYPDRRIRNRSHPAGVHRSDNELNAFDVDDAQRYATFQERWEGGGINFLGSFADLMFDQAANDAVAEFVHSKIDETVDDPATAASLKPRSYPLGAKRPVIATDYYETYNKDNVHLVDVKKTPLDTFTANGFRLADGTEYEVDAMVLATGFDAFTGPFTSLDIRGKGDASLAELWNRDGAKTHLGLGAAGFPNMIIVAGVGSPSVLSNMVSAIEQHVEWISAMLATMRERGYTVIEAQESAQDEWVQTVEEVAAMTLWPNGDSGSWYRGANVEGKVQLFMPYAAGIVEYGNAIDKSAANNYEGFALS